MKLKTPVTIDGTTYTELNFRRPRFGDTEAALNAPSMVTCMAILTSRLADVPIEVVRELDVEDSAAAFEIVQDDLNKIAAAMARK